MFCLENSVIAGGANLVGKLALTAIMCCMVCYVAKIPICKAFRVDILVLVRINTSIWLFLASCILGIGFANIYNTDQTYFILIGSTHPVVM